VTWQELLIAEQRVFPWIGEATLIDSDHSSRKIVGKRPDEEGWYEFALRGRSAKLVGPVDPRPLGFLSSGYLVGDRFVSDGGFPRSLEGIAEGITDGTLPRTYLIEPGLDWFVRVWTGRLYENGPTIYVGGDLPLGPEQEVLTAYLDRAESIREIRGVPPALDYAFRLASAQRKAAERRREAAERERQVRALMARQETAVGRRELARVDFGAAARAALTVGGAVYLDHREIAPGEMAVRYRVGIRRLECTVDAVTFRIIESGICLADHETGEDGNDGRFTLESLPSVVLEGERLGALHVWRHG